MRCTRQCAADGRRCAYVAQAMEKKEAQFNEVLAASNIDPTMLGNITRKLDDVMEQKNKMVKGLQVRPAPAHALVVAPRPIDRPLACSTSWRA